MTTDEDRNNEDKEKEKKDDISIDPIKVDPSKQYKGFEFDQEHTIKNIINSTLDSAVRRLEEHIENAKDAQASNVKIVINWGTLGVKGFGCEDDGRGISIAQKVFKIGSNHKVIEKEEDPSIEQSGRFGEGAKGTLGIADYIEYRSNHGGETDMFIQLRSPNKWDIKQCILVDDTKPRGTFKASMGTRVLAYPIEVRYLKSMAHELPDHTARKFVWLLGTKDLRIDVVIKDEKNRRKEYTIEVPELFRPLFEDYPKKKVNLGVIKDDQGKEHLIEILHTNADKKSERIISYACNHRVVKTFPTEYNAIVIVNCNALPITKDRSAFDQNHRISLEVQTRVEEFLAKIYEKASVFSNLSQREREEHHKVLEELNKLAEEQGLVGPKAKNDINTGEAEVKRDMEPEQWLKTSRTTPPAELKEANILWQKRPGDIVDPEDENALDGGNPPGPVGQSGGTNSVELDPLQERKVLVQEMVEDKRRNKQQWAIRAKIIDTGHKRTIKNGFFRIATHEDSDPNISVSIGRPGDQSGIIWLNTNGYYFRLHHPSSFPQEKFRMPDVLPLVSDGATEILYGTDMSVQDYKVNYNRLLSKLSALFLSAEEKAEQNQNAEDENKDKGNDNGNEEESKK